jgi:hypothetical protein
MNRPPPFVGEHDTAATVLAVDQPRLRVANLAARRQLEAQESTVALQVDPIAANHLAAFTHRQHCGTVNVTPELHRCRMCGSPVSFEGLDFGI